MVTEPLPPPEPAPVTKQSKMQQRFLEMVRQNENKTGTLRITVPSAIRQKYGHTEKRQLRVQPSDDLQLSFQLNTAKGYITVNECRCRNVSAI